MSRFATRQELATVSGGGSHTRSHAMTSTLDHTGGNWKVYHTNGAGQLVEVALGASGTVLRSNGASSAPTFANMYGKGFNVLQGVPSGGDDTAVLQAAITGSGADSTLYIPSGVWQHGELSFVGTGGLRIIGAGRLDTILQFVPTADGQVGLTIDRTGASPSYSCSLEAIGMLCTDNTFDKTALKLVDTGEMYLRDVNILGFDGAGTDSVGLWTQGRESLWVDNLQIGANVHIRIGVNPNTALISYDHFTFRNLYLQGNANATSTLTKACVLIDEGVRGLNLQFEGSQAWVCGSGYGLYWRETGVLGSYNGGIRIANLRTEQGSTPTNYSIYIEGIAGTAPRTVELENCQLDETMNGYYMRNVDMISVKSSILAQGAARTIADVDGFRSMSWDNVYSAATAGAVTTGASYSKRSQVFETAAYTHPHTAVWGIGAVDVIENRTSDPASPVSGQLWLRTDL